VPQSKSSRWFPTGHQVREEGGALERTLRQVLTQHYALQDKVDGMEKAQATSAKSAAGGKAGPFPPGCGPADTYVLGLPVTPVDVQTLTNGVSLKYDAKQRCFTFS